MGAYALLASASVLVQAGDSDLRKDLDNLKKELEARGREIEGLKKERSAARTPIAAAQATVEGKYGPNAPVTTKAGKLTIGGLVQVWYYSIENDNIGFFGDRPGTASGDSNETKDNDGFAIRRAQLRFTMEIHENIKAVVMIDPARSILGRPNFPSNVGQFASSVETGSSSQANSVRRGENHTDAPNRGVLEDAYINYHDVVPHHDFTIGAYKKFLGEEGIRDDAKLDFVERSMIAQTYSGRDTGITVHGAWWDDDRVQYWLGFFNDAGNWFGSSGPQQNRVDDNDQKSFTWRVLVRPVWNLDSWGSLELGASGELSSHGESGTPNALGTGDVDGLGRQRTGATRYYAWVSYKPNGPVIGWWLRGEWGWMRDRNAADAVQVIDATTGFLGSGNTQSAPSPVSVQGFSFSTGYRISESIWKDSAPGWLKSFEFAFRYEQFQNILVADLVRPEQRTDVFATDVWTAGINYYIKGDNAKIQLNYVVVDSPDADSTVTRNNLTPANRPRHFRGVDNNSLVLNFQVGW